MSTLIDYLLVFCRKDLCEARINSKVSSYFQMRCTLRQADPPWYWHLVAKSRIRSSFQMTCPHQMSWPPQCWHLVAKSRIRSSFQMTCPHQMSWPPFSWHLVTNSSIRSSFQIMCTLDELNLVLQSPTTPDMWQNADVPRSGVPPPPVYQT